MSIPSGKYSLLNELKCVCDQLSKVSERLEEMSIVNKPEYQCTESELLSELKYLRTQLTILSREKAHLEISLEAIAEHGDTIESQLIETHSFLENEVAKRTQELAEQNNLLQQEIKERQRVEKALRESEAFSRTLIRETLVGLVLARMDGQLVEVNIAFANMLGYSVEEMLELSFWKLIPEKCLSIAQQHIQNLKIQGRYGPDETEYIHKKGHLVPVRLSGLIIEYRGESRIWMNITDVTEQKQSEAALWQAKESAEQAKMLAEMANRAKSTFLAKMSHELRTPLNAILGYSDILKEEAEDLNYEEIIPDLEKIQIAGQHLLTLVSDVLDISKIEAEKTELYITEFSIATLIENVVTVIQPVLRGNQLKVQHPKDIGTLCADSSKVQQILQNLLNNAAKFTEEGTITLEAMRTSYAVTFQVTDTGIGIPPDKMPYIFDLFRQVDDSYTRRYGGTGLGLSICKHYCQMMNGYIDVKSELGKGSIFIVDLPCVISSQN
jgi:PAS domain S-box-containing protein